MTFDYPADLRPYFKANPTPKLTEKQIIVRDLIGEHGGRINDGVLHSGHDFANAVYDAATRKAFEEAAEKSATVIKEQLKQHGRYRDARECLVAMRTLVPSFIRSLALAKEQPPTET